MIGGQIKKGAAMKVTVVIPTKNEEHTLPEVSQTGGQIDRRCRFADAAFLVGNCQYFCQL